jgi:hypothetical protein
MSVSADSFEKLSEKVDDAKRSIRAAASESEADCFNVYVHDRLTHKTTLISVDRG